MLIVQYLVKTTKTFGGHGNPAKWVSQMFLRTQSWHFQMQKLLKSCELVVLCYYLFPEELTSSIKWRLGSQWLDAKQRRHLSWAMLFVPCIRIHLPNSAALALVAKALLCLVAWLIYSPPYDATCNLVPQEMINGIQMEWDKIVLAARR